MSRKVLYFEGNRDGTIGGTYYYVYDLVNSLNKNRYSPIVGFHSNNLFVDKLSESGIETIVVDYPEPVTFGDARLDKLFFPVRKIVNLFKMLLLPALRYARLLKKHKIQLVHLSNSIAGNHIWILACMITGIKCITHETGFIKKYTSVDRFFAKRMHAIICVSRAVFENMNRQSMNFPCITVIHNGLYENRCSIEKASDKLKSEWGIEPDAPVIGVVGNIRVWKGQETLVRATAILKNKYKNIRCLVVGDTTPGDVPYLEKLKRICKEKNIENNVILTGFQGHPLDYINIMDIFVHTSIEPEPFGIVILEAMFLSKPVITTTIGGPAEIIEDGISGILIKPDEPQLLAEAIDSLLADKMLSEEYGAAAFEELKKDFTMKKNAESVMRIYDQAF